MTASNDSVQALRAALAVSPDNVPLRQHLCETLVRLGNFAEAVDEYRALLPLAPARNDFKLALAEAYDQLGKQGEALVIVEDLVRRADSSAAAHLLYARLLWRGGDGQRAAAQYREALDLDPDLADPEFAERLGLHPDPSDVVDGRVRIGRTDDSHAAAGADIERPRIGFADVGGMSELKEEIRLKIIYPLERPEIYAAYGKKIGGGILMYGPPGCGKTHLARATAGEIKAGFLSIGINDVLDMWLGNSERNLHQIFEQARESKPCVLFFDEVDALGSKRSDMQGGASRHVINQFLSEMDGLGGTNEGVLVLAATNAPWHVDAAFRRPGRFDRVLFVPPPDAGARAEILGILCRGKPMRDLDLAAIAKATDGFSGADLQAVVDLAIEAKLQAAIRSGGVQPVTQKDLLQAAKSHRATTKEWFATARNYALYANQGGLYDEVLKHLK